MIKWIKIVMKAVAELECEILSFNGTDIVFKGE